MNHPPGLPLKPTSDSDPAPELDFPQLSYTPGAGNQRRNRRKPVVSCGLICFYSQTDQIPTRDMIRVLLIRRKDSLSYVEFVRGKYKPEDSLYIHSLLRGMTIEEHTAICTKSFHALWTSMWGTDVSYKHTAQYNKSHKRYKKCIQNVRSYIASHPSSYTEPEWTFPKGRPMKRESDLDCALREFEEETGIAKRRIRLYSSVPIVETHVGSNGVTYETRLFVSSVDVRYPRVDYTNRVQMSEVSDIRWCDDLNAVRFTPQISQHDILQQAIRKFLMDDK